MVRPQHVSAVIAGSQADAVNVGDADVSRHARAAGAWLAGGITQVDDQQHALSALLVYRALLAGRQGSAR